MLAKLWAFLSEPFRVCQGHFSHAWAYNGGHFWRGGDVTPNWRPEDNVRRTCTRCGSHQEAYYIPGGTGKPIIVWETVDGRRQT